MFGGPPGVAALTVLPRLPVPSVFPPAFELSQGRSGQSSGLDFSYPQGKKDVNASHSRYRALGPELIPVYRRKSGAPPAGDHKSTTRR